MPPRARPPDPVHGGEPPPAAPAAAAAAPAAAADLSVLQADLRLAGRLDARFFELLRALGETGSLRRAAQTAGYSYKGAWLVLEAAQAQTRAPLFETATGGRGGGGSRLTAAATTLLDAWDDLNRRHRAFLRAEEQRLLAAPGLAGLLRHTAMRTSARNQFAGRIVAIESDGWTSRVQVAIAGGHRVTVATTDASLAATGAAIGRDALVLVKAPKVTLVDTVAAEAMSATNRLSGTVARVDRGPVTMLVVLTLPGGATVVATASRESADALGLAVGEPAVALFKATSGLLAVAG